MEHLTADEWARSLTGDELAATLAAFARGYRYLPAPTMAAVLAETARRLSHTGDGTPVPLPAPPGHLGRPTRSRGTGKPPGKRLVSADVERRVHELRAGGMSYRAIAATLDAEGYPTARSGRPWDLTSVRRIVLRAPREVDE